MTEGKESKFINIAFFLSIVSLFIMVSYNRFLVYGSLYFPLFKMAWDPSLYPGDLIQSHIFLTSGCIFYTPIGWISSIANYLEKENLLFIIYLIKNLAVLFICYKTAMVYSSKRLAMFFVVILFGGWVLLPGASLSIVYPHHLSPTAFAFIPAALAIYFYIKKKYFPFFICVAFTCLMHLKTAFAIGIPLGICIFWDMATSSRDRKDLMSNVALAAPILLFVAYVYSTVSSNFRGCGEGFIKAMVEQTRGESDLLAIGAFRFYEYNYFFINILSSYLYICNYSRISIMDRRIFRLVVAANVGLLLGIVVSIVHRHVVPFPYLMCFPWPKIAIVSNYACLLIILRYLVFNERFWQGLRPLTMGFILFFVSGFLLNVNIFFLRLMPKALLVIFLVYLIVYFSGKINKQAIKRFFFATFVLFIAFGSVYIHFREFQKNLNNKARYKWDRTAYRMPFNFNLFLHEYDAVKWLDDNADPGSMHIIPVIKHGRLVFENGFRPYTDLPVFYTSDLDDVIGSCVNYKEWKRRREVLQEWLNTKNIDVLYNNNIYYVVTQKANRDLFAVPMELRVYENEKMIVYKIM